MSVCVTSKLQNTKHYSITLFRKMYAMKYSRITVVIYCVIFVYIARPSKIICFFVFKTNRLSHLDFKF